MGILCTLKNLSLHLGVKELFKDASFVIEKGDRIGLLGPNGQGKSTLFKVISGEITPDESDPPFMFDKGPEFSCFIVPQELPEKDNHNLTIKDYLGVFYPNLKKNFDALKKINLDLEKNSTSELLKEQKKALDEIEHEKGWELLNSFESYLKYFGIFDFDKKVYSLSGGEQKKILLALGLTAPHELILWDEPTNHLDVETIELFEDELNQTQKTIMVITHDRYLLSKVTNKTIHLKLGKIDKFKGGYTEFLEYLAESEEKKKKLLTKLSNTLRREQEWMRQGIKARGTRSKKRVEGFHNLGDKIRSIKDQERKSLTLSISSSEKRSKKLLDFKDISVKFGDRTLFKEINLTIYRGDKIGLLGENGIGKSTLMKVISGEVVPTVGNLNLPKDIVVEYFSQKRDELPLDKTIKEILGDSQDYIDLPDGRRLHVNAYAESFLFSKDVINRPLSTFSGGEKNRLQLALHLKKAADLWIFDEPTNDLDLETLQILEDKLQDFGGTLIIISHDRAFLENATNSIWLLKNETIEVFNAGLSQVKSYLDAVKIEEEFLKEEALAKNEVKVDLPKSDTQKLTYKEKIRLKDLPKLISNLEKEIETLTSKVSSFDFNSMDKEKGDLFSKLSLQLEENENKLLELYQEQEELSAKES